MKKIDNSVGNKSECYGCGMCATVCPANVLNICRNRDGFYVPQITNSRACTGCGLCSKICGFNSSESPEYHTPLSNFAGWSNDESIRKICSSGGIAFEIANHFIKLGYKICAVRYNPETRTPEHYISSSKEDILQSIGSKYLQSNTYKAFSEIDLNGRYVIIGSPCQIDMWRRYLKLRKKESNFILVDFFCHGVPSYLLWEKYLRENKKQIQSSSMITWRDKVSGWHSSWNICAYKNDNFWNARPYYRSSNKQGDGFYFMFLGNGVLNPACFSACKYKKYNSSADVRLGDLWGSEYADDEKGVSGILTFTDRGSDAIARLNISTTPVSAEVVTECQISQPLSRPWYYGLSKFAVRHDLLSIKRLRRIIVLAEIIQYQVNKVKRIWK